MEITGAVVREQGVTFAVVAVQRSVLQNRGSAEQAVVEFTPIFRMPIVLMAQDGRGTPSYFGRPDLSRFLAHVPLNAIPWKKYRIN